MANRILSPGRNVWRVENASRAAVLIDGAAFFGAVRQAFLNARHSIFVLGWDIDSRTRLVGNSAAPDDGLPANLSEFLTELVRQRPELRINLLLWDYSLLYASERELFPRLSLQWRTPEQITLSLDNIVPVGCSQHQKIIVVDNAVAFSGGLDLTIRRWDTADHSANNPHRVDPSGHPFHPFHDVQMMVDGMAARALAEIACERWERAVGCRHTNMEPADDPWPKTVKPDFIDVGVGIARTQPGYNGIAEVREAEHLFVNSIATAERSIYIENQYVTSPLVARALSKRLRERKELEVLIVAPRRHKSWVESKSMRNGRIRFWRMLQRAGANRVRLMYPHVDDGKEDTQTMIHSKVMVIDDVFLRIGSANLNNRSMGADSECDLAIEAKGPAERIAIADIRDRLLGEHCGVSAAEVGRDLAIKHQSLIAVAETLTARGHSLRPIDDGKLDDGELADVLEEIADPPTPINPFAFAIPAFRRLRATTGGLAIALTFTMLLVLSMTLAWNVTPLSEWASPDITRDTFKYAAQQPWAGALVVATFLVGGLVAFPVVVLIVATAAAFGPYLGFLYALLGVLASALLTYALGALFGQRALRRLLGSTLDQVRTRIEHHGVLAIAAIRLVPIAPFTLVNVAAGASGIKLVDYVAGTLVGMLPGLIALSALGHRVFALISNPSLSEAGLLALVILLWVAAAFGVQALVSRLAGRVS